MLIRTVYIQRWLKFEKSLVIEAAKDVKGMSMLFFCVYHYPLLVGIQQITLFSSD